MTIVINTCSLLKTGTTEKAIFFKACINQIITNNPAHSFILITAPNNEKLVLLPHVINLSIAPTSKNLLRWKFWYAYTLPKIFKKYKADLFFNIDSISVNKSGVAQCLTIAGFDTPSCLGFGKKKTTEFFNKASLLITHSATDKEALIKQYILTKKPLFVVPLAANENFVPIDYAEKEQIKEQYAGAKEYFLFSGHISDENNLITLLKAFSFFKKRQKSNMQLLIVTKAVLPDNTFIKSLASYKYKAEVRLLFDLSQQEYIKIMAAAYAFICPATITNSYVPVLEAMQSGVPVIVHQTTLMNEICGNAALYTAAENFENIADKMMLLYKDENTRAAFIETGLLQSKKNSMAVAASLFWQYLVQTAKETS